MTGRSFLALALVLGACGSTDDRGPSSGPVADVHRADRFALELSSDRSEFESGEPIEVEATLTYEGEGEGDATVWGSGSGLVGFTLERLEDGLTPGAPIFTGDCVPHEFESAAPVIIPFAKSGAYDENTPNLDFVRRYLDDPELRLPAGTWRITATAAGYLGETCAPPKLHLESSIEVRVADD